MGIHFIQIAYGFRAGGVGRTKKKQNTDYVTTHLNPAPKLVERVMCHKRVARSPRPVPALNGGGGGVGRAKYARTIPDPAQTETENSTQKLGKTSSMENVRKFPKTQGSGKKISSAEAMRISATHG